eukprot:gene16473-biopygen8254
MVIPPGERQTQPCKTYKLLRGTRPGRSHCHFYPKSYRQWVEPGAGTGQGARRPYFSQSGRHPPAREMRENSDGGMMGTWQDLWVTIPRGEVAGNPEPSAVICELRPRGAPVWSPRAGVHGIRLQQAVGVGAGN